MAPKKEKAQKMQLGEFLQDTSLGSWADEMEDMPMPSPSGRPAWGGGDKSYGAGGGFGSRGATDDRGFSFREELPLPSKPPYTVHLGNLSFDSTEGDVADFFADCEVDNIRIVEDKLDSKPKGFGYVEFKTLDGLKKSLDLSGRQFQGRNIRVSVAEPQKDRQDTRDFSDWSRKGPLPDAPQQGNRKGPERGGFPSSGGGFGSGDPRRGPPSGAFDAVSEAGSERGGRRGYEPSDGKVRDFGNWDRKGPLTPTLPAGAPARSFERPVSRDGAPPNFRRNSPAWGEGRSQDSGSRPPRREFVERPVIERAPTAADQDTQWRARMKADPPPAPPTPNVAAARSPALSQRELSNPPSPATSGSAAAATPAAPAAPASRPKLNLAKRTVSEANPESTAAPASDSKASPFGAARPIDTATREKEVEEKRQIALKDKKEADEKAREEKRVADDKAKEDRRLAKEAELANRSASRAEQSPKSPVQQNGDKRQFPRREKSESKPKPEKETNGGAPAPGKQYEILRRHAEEEGSAMDEEHEEVDANANGVVVGDKETKPQEIVRDPKTDAHTNGATTQPASESTTDALEEDGWNVVEKTGKKGKKNPTSRALAS